MPFRRKRRMLLGKAHEKHSGTKVFTIGPGTVATPFHIIRESEVGDRDPAGGNDTIQLGRSFEEECNIGDLCKFVNIHIQAGPRTPGSGQNIGWIEWAFTISKGSDAQPVNTNLGTQTLGNVMTTYMRNECLYTGAIPVGFNQPAVAEISLKIPKSRCALRVGDEWTLWMIARTVSATETATDTFRVISSFNYINYH